MIGTSCAHTGDRYSDVKGPHTGIYCSLCKAWLRWEAKPVDRDRAIAFKMPFGKYRGIALSEIPNDYLAWLADECADYRISLMAQILINEPPRTKASDWPDLPF